MIERRDDPMHCLDGGKDVVVGEDHPLGGPGRAGGEDELDHVAGLGARPGVQLGFPVGRERLVRLGGEGVEQRRRDVLEARVAWDGGIAAGPEDEPLRVRAGGDALDCIGCHPEVERDDDEARPHRPVVGGRQFRCRWRPGEDPVARLKACRAQPPGRDPASTLQLAVRPVLAPAVIAAHPEGRPIGMPSHRVVEEVENRADRARHPADRTRQGSVSAAKAAAKTS